MKKNIELTLEKVKEIQLEALSYINKICRQNDIKYTAFGGTLIGAIRHKGYIPWDDDIDIAMRRDDYNKLKNLLKDNDTYAFLDAETTKDYYYPYGKIVVKNTKLVETGFKPIEEMGVYIDVFPIDKVKTNNCKAKLKYIRFLINLKNCGLYNAKFDKSEKLKYKISRFIKPFVNPYRLNKKIVKLAQKENKKDCKYEGTISENLGKTKYICEKEMFGEYIDCPFEHMSIMIVKDYDKYLRQIFGDYMKFPPKDEQVPKHNFKAYYR